MGPPTPAANGRARGSGAPAEEWERDFRAVRDAYPPRQGDIGIHRAREIYSALRRAGEDPGEILAGTIRYEHHATATGVAGTKYVKLLWRFLEERGWEEAWDIRVRGSPAPPNGGAVPLEARRDAILAEVARLQG
jgi:hypothetical protein